jgi:hypothetical protein
MGMPAEIVSPPAAIGNSLHSGMRIEESATIRLVQVRELLLGVGDRLLVRFTGVFVRFSRVLVGLVVVARLMVRGGFVMMFGGFLVVLGCFVVSFDCHVESSTWGVPRRASKHTANTTVDRSRRRFTISTSSDNLNDFLPSSWAADLTSIGPRYTFSTGCRSTYIIVIRTITM